MENYALMEVVGEGTYGVVMKCMHKRTNAVVAVKRFKQTDSNEYVRCTMLRELCVQRLLKGEPNVVQLLETFMENGRLFLVMEYFQSNLLDVLNRNPTGLQLETLRLLVYTLIVGVNSCHRNNVVHRDIKPENILVDESGNAYLCDFGFARPIARPQISDGKESSQSEKNTSVLNKLIRPDAANGNMTVYVATRWYRSPEMLLAMEHYDYSVDMWAVGAIMAEAADGQPLLPGRSELEQLALIQERVGEFPEEYLQLIEERTSGSFRVASRREKGALNSYIAERFLGIMGEAGVDLLHKLLALKSSDRVTAEEALHHPFFNAIPNKHKDLRDADTTDLFADKEGSVSESFSNDSLVLSRSSRDGSVQNNLTPFESQISSASKLPLEESPIVSVQPPPPQFTKKVTQRRSLPNNLKGEYFDREENKVAHSAHSRIKSDSLDGIMRPKKELLTNSLKSASVRGTTTENSDSQRICLTSRNNSVTRRGQNRNFPAESPHSTTRPPKSERSKRASTAQGKRNEITASAAKAALSVPSTKTRRTKSVSTPMGKKTGTARYMSTTRKKISKLSKKEKPLLLKELESFCYVGPPQMAQIAAELPDNPSSSSPPPSPKQKRNSRKSSKKPKRSSAVEEVSANVDMPSFLSDDSLLDETNSRNNSNTKASSHNTTGNLPNVNEESSSGNRKKVNTSVNNNHSPKNKNIVMDLNPNSLITPAVIFGGGGGTPNRSRSGSPVDVSPMQRPAPLLRRCSNTSTGNNSPAYSARLMLPRSSNAARYPPVLAPLSQSKEDLKRAHKDNVHNLVSPKEVPPLCASPTNDTLPRFVRKNSVDATNASANLVGFNYHRNSAALGSVGPTSQSITALSPSFGGRVGHLQPLSSTQETNLIGKSPTPANRESSPPTGDQLEEKQKPLADVYKFYTEKNKQKKKGRLVLGEK